MLTPPSNARRNVTDGIVLFPLNLMSLEHLARWPTAWALGSQSGNGRTISVAIDVSAVRLLTAIVGGAISSVSRCVGGILLRYAEANLLGGALLTCLGLATAGLRAVPVLLRDLRLFGGEPCQGRLTLIPLDFRSLSAGRPHRSGPWFNP